MQKKPGRFCVILVGSSAMLACSSGEARTAYANSAPPKTVVASDSSAATISQPGEALRLVLSAAGSAARYRVRERLVGHDLPNDAVGETKALTGAIAFDSSGKVIRQPSEFTFADVSMEQPRVPVLLSVADTIRLEIDFNLVVRHARVRARRLSGSKHFCPE